MHTFPDQILPPPVNPDGSGAEAPAAAPSAAFQQQRDPHATREGGHGDPIPAIAPGAGRPSVTSARSGRPWNAQTTHGYALDEVVSALQKTIRRGLVDEAMFWAHELNQSGYGAYAWRRLMVIASEDIGIADDHAPVLVNALYQMSAELHKAGFGTAAEKATRPWNEESILHAAWYLARASKNRELVDAACTMTLRMSRGKLLEIPDAALDSHTARGRAQGRGEGFFQREGRKIAPEAVIDGNKWSVAWQAERPRDRDG